VRLPFSRNRILLLAACALGAATHLGAQTSRLTMLDFATGTDYEEYLRILQIAGEVPFYPWSIRAFSPREISKLAGADTLGPWKVGRRITSAHVSAGPFAGGTIFNSAFPYGSNDGAVWAGRGLTLVGSGGIAGRVGPLSFQVDPVAFSATNRPFELLSNGQSGPLRFNHGTSTGTVDLPQRFGDGAYSRLDPGQSDIRLDTRFVTAGVSTANEWIGPATEYPFLLSNNAAGFPHLFVGTGEPLNIGLGRIHGRVMWGRLDQSAYSPVGGTEHFIPRVQTGTVRLMASAEGVFIPRGLPGLELGVARFIHVPYFVGSPDAAFWKKPFKVFFLKNEFAQGDSSGADNQLASIFFRWVFPRAGLEVYGERGYEDQFYDTREFIENIDHDREYMLGLQKVVRKRSDGFDVLKAELINYQNSTLVFTRATEGTVYAHSTLRQGHTNRGELLGAYPGVGGAAASTFSWTRYSPKRRTTLSFRRILRDQIGNFETTGIVNPKGSDVIIAGRIERMRYASRLDTGARLELMDDLNHNFARDVGNLNLQLTARLHAR
jgi:hypothetical protein